ncbi:XRE family transcriptional regulator [Sinorhizobium fredii]|uniref:XRE family transcriptional regulator n=1 Tax=Rhizobium fredii TaxID=380 RepID=UPI0012FD2997|nr:XRE family transcriptional regulator [Sinorhizobium fredii]
MKLITKDTCNIVDTNKFVKMVKMKKTRLTQMLLNQQNKSGLTESEIGAQHGFSQQAFSTWKAGVVPRPKMYPAIASFLRISVDQVAELAEEAKTSTGSTKLPELGAPVHGRGDTESIAIDKFPSGFAKPSVSGTYALRIDGRYVWVNPRLKPVAGNEVIVRTGSSGRVAKWPTEVSPAEEAHVIVLRETV